MRTDTAGRRVLATGTLWFLAYLGARFLLEMGGLATWQRVTVALVPVPFFAAFLWALVRGVGALDELERRIHLEALAVAFPLAVLLLMSLGLLELAVPLPAEDLSYRHVWAFLPAMYLLGIARARRRYGVGAPEEPVPQ